MSFSKAFPKYVKGSNYPRWEEVYLTEEEESMQEQKARIENIKLFKECLDDAMKIVDSVKLKRYQSDLISVAISLFEKRASHSIYWKESKAKEKFDESNKELIQ